jgi:hypothetical protein
LRGDARALAEAELERKQENRRLNKLAAGRGALSEDQAKQLDADIAAARLAADAKFNEKRDEIFRNFAAKNEASEREHADKLQALNLEDQQARLEAQDQFLNSKLLGIEAAAKAERDAAKRAYDDALKDPDQDPRKAAERRDALIAAANRRSHDQEVAARVEAAKDVAQKSAEEYAKELDAEDEARADRQRFKPSAIGAFAGESRLISGVVGGAAKDPTVEPIQRTAKAVDKTARLTELIEEHMRDVRDSLSKPDKFTVIR